MNKLIAKFFNFICIILVSSELNANSCTIVITASPCDSSGYCGANSKSYEYCARSDGHTYIYDGSTYELIALRRDTHIPCSFDDKSILCKNSPPNAVEMQSRKIGRAKDGSASIDSGVQEKIENYKYIKEKLLEREDLKEFVSRTGKEFKQFKKQFGQGVYNYDVYELKKINNEIVFKSFIDNLSDQFIKSFEVPSFQSISKPKLPSRYSPKHPLIPYVNSVTDVVNMYDRRKKPVNKESVGNAGWDEYVSYSRKIKFDNEKLFSRHEKQLKENLINKQESYAQWKVELQSEEGGSEVKLLDPISVPRQEEFQVRIKRTDRMLLNYKPLTKDEGIIKNVGRWFIEESKNSWTAAEHETATRQLKVAENSLDVLLGLDPISGTLRSAYEVATGRNLVTGEALDKWNYSFAVIGMFSLGYGSKLGKAGRLVGRMAEDLANSPLGGKLPGGIAADGIGLFSEVIGSAWELGLKTKDEIRDFVDLSKRIVGNEIGEVGDLTKVIKGKMTRFSPIKRGPLEDSVANTFRSKSYFMTVTDEPVKLYRVHGDGANPLSKYWSRSKPSGPMQATFDSALDPAWGNSAKKWVEITVPKGEKLFEGIVSKINLKRGNRQISTGQLLGGGSQVYIDKTRIPKNWISNEGGF